MTEQATEKKKKKTWYGRVVTWTFRLLLLLIALMTIFLGGMSLLSGTEDIHKSGIEQALSDLFGVRAEIGTLEDLTFFPIIKLEAKDIKFYEREGETRNVQVDALRFSYGFWHYILGKKIIKDLYLEGVEARPGFYGAQRLKLDKLEIVQESPKPDENIAGKAFLKAKGAYGGKTFDAAFELQITPRGYLFTENLPFRVSFETLHAQGLLTVSDSGMIGVETLEIKKDKPLFTGAIYKTDSNLDVDINVGSSKIHSQLALEGKNISGRIAADPLEIKDREKIEDIINILSETFTFQTEEKEKSKAIDLSFSDLDIDLKVLSLLYNGHKLGDLSLPVSLKEEKMTIKPVKGTINKGTVAGSIVLDAKPEEAELKVDLTLKKWAFGDFQKKFFDKEDVSANADMLFSIEGKGNGFDAILKNFKGRASLIAGKGEWKTAAVVNSWGSNLFNVMLPDLDPESETKLNCAIADFIIEDGVAKSETLFMDTKRVVLQGKGSVNLPEQTLNIKLSPDSKNPGILDVATAVRVKGPFSDLSIGPDTLSLGKKVGGLLLGVVNPAFLVISLTDLGLAEDHPCVKFIQEETQDVKEKVKEEKAVSSDEKNKTEIQRTEVNE